MQKQFTSLSQLDYYNKFKNFNKGIDPTFGNFPIKKHNIFSGAAADPSCRNQRSLKNRIKKKKEAGAQFITNSNGYGKKKFDRIL